MSPAEKMLFYFISGAVLTRLFFELLGVVSTWYKGYAAKQELKDAARRWDAVKALTEKHKEDNPS